MRVHVAKWVGVLSLASAFCFTDLSAAEWRQLQSGTKEFLTHVHCRSADECWIAGGDGGLYFTQDGGKKWEAVKVTLDPATLNAVHFINGSVGWFSGLKVVGRSLDGGFHWTIRTHPNAINQAPLINRVFALNENTAYAAGATPFHLTLWRYHFDAQGQLFETVLTISRPHIFSDVMFPTASRGWAVGSGGVIYRIDDPFGEPPELTPQVSGVVGYLNAVDMLPSGTGWSVGDGGIILATTDAGDTWGSQLVDDPKDLYDVDAVSEKTAWVVGTGGSLLRTQDGGLSWVPVQKPVSGVFIKSVHFPESDVGFAVGEGGLILKWAADVCGDATVGSAEECDEGPANGTSGACCSSQCELRAAGEVCRPGRDQCDATEICTGTESLCPEDLRAADKLCEPLMDAGTPLPDGGLPVDAGTDNPKPGVEPHADAAVEGGENRVDAGQTPGGSEKPRRGTTGAPDARAPRGANDMDAGLSGPRLLSTGGGCDCRVRKAEAARGPWWLLGVVALGAGRRRSPKQ